MTIPNTQQAIAEVVQKLKLSTTTLSKMDMGNVMYDVFPQGFVEQFLISELTAMQQATRAEAHTKGLTEGYKEGLKRVPIAYEKAYQDKIAKFKKENIEKYNPYQTKKLPDLSSIPKELRAQVWDQVRDQVGAQVWDQVGATSYWGIKVVLGLPIKHWFFDFLKLGIMIIFVKGKVKVFGKKGKYLGEWTEDEWLGK